MARVSHEARSAPDAEAGLELVRRGTRFADPETEARYRAWQIAQAVPFNRAGMFASLGSWALILTTVTIFLPRGISAWLIAVGVVMAAILVSLAILYRPTVSTLMAPSVMLANALAGFAAVGLLVYHVHTLEGGVLSAAIVSYYGFVIFRLRPGQAALAVATYVGWTGWLLVREPAYVQPVAGSWHLWVAALVVIYGSGLIANVVFDGVSRQSYRQERIIEAQKRTIAFERGRSEALLKQEISHQVAERSRELGQMLAKIEASLVVGRLSPGDRFDKRYRVVRALGSGGMGSVYEVERLTDEQRLALKIVTGEVSGAHAARFAREAEIGARVRHANVVPIVDVGIAEGVPFLAMELAEHSLEEQRGRFGDAAWARPILAEIAGGLAALHAAGIVHRDLKPANVLFTPSENNGRAVAKIADFGISTFGSFGPMNVDPAAATMEERSSRPPQGGLTATGTLLGTPYYMAPESVRGATAVRAPADAFAFGILACEMLEGRTPFATPPIFLAMTGAPIPPPSLDLAGVDGALRDALMGCLTEDPAKRPAMDALAKLLA